ncbi:MAG: ribonuclease Z [Candidatus Micrarchaeia archaeon]
MLRLTFLGTSASIPTVERSLPAISLRGKEHYLWDCGEGAQRQMMRYRVGFGSIKAIFISHLHLDHFLGIYGLIETLRLSSSSVQQLKIFAPKRFEELLINKWDFLEVQEIKPGLLLKDSEASISAFRVVHSKESFGFIYAEHEKIKFHEAKAHGLGLRGAMFKEIQEKGHVKIGGKKILLEDVSWKKPGLKVVYSGDCVSCKSTINAAKGADLLIHEATFGSGFEKEAIERNHSTAKQAAQLAKEAGAKKLILTHLSGRYKDAKSLLDEAQKIFPNTSIAEDGLNIELR